MKVARVLEAWVRRGGDMPEAPYADPGGRFFLLPLVWEPGSCTPVHDHGTWGVMAVVHGAVQVTRYRRLDDGRVPGYADLHAEVPELHGVGSVGVTAEIHRMESARGARTLHVTGREIMACNVYDVYHKRVRSEGEPAWK